jgi:hypothetical protein
MYTTGEEGCSKGKNQAQGESHAAYLSSDAFACECWLCTSPSTNPHSSQVDSGSDVQEGGEQEAKVTSKVS